MEFMDKQRNGLLTFSICVHLRNLWAIVLFASFMGFAEERTNVVLIVVDDMGYSDLGCYGSEIPTPNIDSLAKNGLRFRQFYNTAKCWTTRASLLTGLYHHQVTEQKILERNGVTIAEALGENGYRTIMSGKWHLSGGQLDNPEFQPLARGFDEFYGTILWAGSFPKDIDFLNNIEIFNKFSLHFFIGDSDELFSEEVIRQYLKEIKKKEIQFNLSRYNGGHKVLPQPLLTLQKSLSK